MPRIRGGTLFSGIGAPECAMPWVDWLWAADIDPFASTVHAARFPRIQNLGDVNDIDPDAVEPVDLIVFGSPCQSFSVAGKRLGLDDPRGNMALVGLRVVGRIRPRWVVWENVPGVLSSDGGRDFGAFLGLLGELGYGFAYRVLDAQHFGVPQRRRRVFVVGCLGNWNAAAAVLFEPESLRGDSSPRREAGQETPARSLCGTDGGIDREDRHTLIAFLAKDHGADHGDIAPTLRAGTQDKSHANAGVMPAVAYGGNRQSGPLDVATAVNAHGGPHGRLDFESETFVTHSLRADGFDASEGRGTPLVTHALDSRSAGRATEDGTGRGRPLVAFQVSQSGVRLGEQHATLDSNNGSCRHHGALQGMSVRRLTPRECEHLQGLPEIRSNAIIAICSSGHQKHSVLAEIQNPRSPIFASHVGGGAFPQIAKSAKNPSSINLLCRDWPVALSVHIDLERGAVRLLKAGKCIWSASNADSPNTFLHRVTVADFVRDAARLTQNVEPAVTLGKAGSHPSSACSFRLPNGSGFVVVSGREIAAVVDAAEPNTGKATSNTRSTTSQAGSASQSSGSTLETSCCSVISAISGFIPDAILSGDLFIVSVEVVAGWTSVPYRGKPAADGPRYRAIGNSMAVPVLSWLGTRIQMADNFIQVVRDAAD